MTIQWNGLDSGLAPGFASLITSVVGPLSGLYTVQQGFRSIVQQNAAYSLGRDANGNVINAAAVVTNAKGGQSPHNYGLAVDLYPVIGGQVDYGFSGGQSEPSATALPYWTALWNAVRASGSLTTGADFSLASGYDPGHIELTNWRAYMNTTVPADVTAVAPPAAAAPTNPDGTLTYNGLPYDAFDYANPYNNYPTNPDGTPTYNGLPYDPSDPNNPYTLAGGLPPVSINAAAPGGFSLSTPTLLAGAAVLGILWLMLRAHRRQGA